MRSVWTAGKRTLAIMAIGLLAACSVGVKRTPGMNLYSSGNLAEAIPLLEQEVAQGEVSARYPLGLAYRDGQGVARDPVKAEILLTGAAIAGDPRAVTAIRELLQQADRCSKDLELRNYWGQVGTMHRNLVTGVVELNTAAPVILRKMAALYDQPCQGAVAQPEAARSLRSLSGGPRYVWIYVPR
jgi:TPR repeat protein